MAQESINQGNCHLFLHFKHFCRTTTQKTKQKRKRKPLPSLYGVPVFKDARNGFGFMNMKRKEERVMHYSETAGV